MSLLRWNASISNYPCYKSRQISLLLKTLSIKSSAAEGQVPGLLFQMGLETGHNKSKMKSNTSAIPYTTYYNNTTTMVHSLPFLRRMTSASFLIFTILLSWNWTGIQLVKGETEGVIQLTAKNFDKSIGDGNTYLIEFFAPW